MFRLCVCSTGNTRTQAHLACNIVSGISFAFCLPVIANYPFFSVVSAGSGNYKYSCHASSTTSSVLCLPDVFCFNINVWYVKCQAKKENENMKKKKKMKICEKITGENAKQKSEALLSRFKVAGKVSSSWLQWQLLFCRQPLSFCRARICWQL